MITNTVHNRRLAQWRVKRLIEHSTSHQLLWCIDSFVLRNPPLLIPENVRAHNPTENRNFNYIWMIVTLKLHLRLEKYVGLWKKFEI
jgi:hypothetical protein